MSNSQEEFLQYLTGLHTMAGQLKGTHHMFAQVQSDLANAAGRIDPALGMKLRHTALTGATIEGSVQAHMENKPTPVAFSTTPPPRRANRSPQQIAAAGNVAATANRLGVVEDDATGQGEELQPQGPPPPPATEDDFKTQPPGGPRNGAGVDQGTEQEQAPAAGQPVPPLNTPLPNDGSNDPEHPAPEVQAIIGAHSDAGNLTTVPGELLAEWAQKNPQQIAKSMKRPQMLAVISELPDVEYDESWNKEQLAGAIRAFAIEATKDAQ